MKRKLNRLATCLVIGTIVVSCKGEKKETKKEPEVGLEASEMDLEVVEMDILVLDEHHFNDVPITSHGKKILAKEQTPQSESKPEDYDVYTKEEMHVELLADDYVPAEVQITAAAIPLEETQTLLAYNKKDKQQGMLQIVTDANGEIDKIAFADKNHRDTYDVSNGMTAKEARQLRRRLKHVVKKSDHYLYDDQSNIMYLLDIEDNQGNAITEAEIDKSEIRAIIWQDKKKD